MPAVWMEHKRSASLGKQDSLYVYDTGGQSVMPLYVFGKKWANVILILCNLESFGHTLAQWDSGIWLN